MIRHIFHRLVCCSRNSLPKCSETEYFYDPSEITAIRDYSPTNHCFYLLLLTFIDILENPHLCPRFPGDSQNETPLTQKSGQVSMHQQDRDDRGSIFWYKSHFVSKCLTEEVRAPNFAKFAGCPAAKYRGKHTLPRALRHKLSPNQIQMEAETTEAARKMLTFHNISQHFREISTRPWRGAARPNEFPR
jgi:hypothetical protein